MNRAGNAWLRTRLMAGILLASFPTACQSWQTEHLTTQQRSAGTRPRTMRVTLADNNVVTVYEAHVDGDSLVGLGAAHRPIALPLTEVKHIEVEKTDAAKTTLLVVGVVGVAALVVGLVKLAECLEDIAVQPC